MRHRRDGRKLGITAEHRKAMLANMVGSLFKQRADRNDDSEGERGETPRREAHNARASRRSRLTAARRPDDTGRGDPAEALRGDRPALHRPARRIHAHHQARHGPRRGRRLEVDSRAPQEGRGRAQEEENVAQDLSQARHARRSRRQGESRRRRRKPLPRAPRRRRPPRPRRRRKARRRARPRRPRPPTRRSRKRTRPRARRRPRRSRRTSPRGKSNNLPGIGIVQSWS